MSCWRKCASVIRDTDIDILKEAVGKMGLGIDTNVKRVGTSYGTYDTNSANVDGAFIKNGHKLELGYVLKGSSGNLEVVGDFWNSGLNNETFLGTLGQLYREIQIQQQAEMMGYTIDSVTTNAQGDTVIEVYSWA